MPALPRFRIESLASLARELRFESREAARRQLERAEKLALEVLAERDAARAYPLEYVRFRITGLSHEPESAGRTGGRPPEVLVGAALLADLGVLVERLSAAAGLTEEELRGDRPATQRPARGAPRTRPDGGPGGPWLSVRELGARWSVGPKTLERLRRRGLLARRVRAAVRAGTPARGAAARQVLMFSMAAIEAFERAGIRDMPAPGGKPQRSQVRAARAPRLSPSERAMIVRRAARYRRRLGWTLNRCAARIAPRVGRSMETVRRALRKHDRDVERLFSERGPLTEQERATVERSRRAGIPARRMSARLARSAATVHRVWIERRAERLRRLGLGADGAGYRGPLFDRPAAADVHLAPAAVCDGLGGGAPADVAAFIATCEAMEPPVVGVESARAVAYWFLRFRAAAAIERLGRRAAGARAVDAIETDLRWASRLKAELVRSQMPTALRSIRARLGADAPISASLVEPCIGALIASVDKFDPFRALAAGGRLAAPATIAVNRVITRWLGHRADGTPGAARAARRIEPTALQDWTLRVDPWQAWLEPGEEAARVLRSGIPVAGLDARAMRVLRMRLGLGDDRPPMTALATARALGTTVTAVSGIERRGLAALEASGG